MILLPSRTQRIAHVPLLFRAHDCLDDQGLFALSYGRKVYAVFSRTGHAMLTDQRGRLVRMPGAAPRVQVERWDSAAWPALLLEALGENLVPWSEDFTNWSVGSVVVTANAAAAPDGAQTADLLTATGTSDFASIAVTYPSDGVAVVSFHLREGTPSAVQHIVAFDGTATLARHQVSVTWVSGVPVLATVAGSGQLFQPWRVDGGWRGAFTATGIVALNSNTVAVYPDRNIGTGGVYAWGIQAELGTVPSSYMRTAGAAAGRNAESCYVPFARPMGPLQAFVAGVERGTNLGATDRALFSLGAGGNASLFVDGGGASYSLFHRKGADDSSTVSTPTAFGDEVWIRARLADSGAVTLAQTVNRGVEEIAAPSAGTGLAAAWDQLRFYLGSRSTVPGLFAFRAACIAPEGLSRDALADLCEVA